MNKKEQAPRNKKEGKQHLSLRHKLVEAQLALSQEQLVNMFSDIIESSIHPQESLSEAG